MHRPRLRASLPLALALLTIASVAPTPASAQAVPTMESHFGFVPGEERRLAPWDQLLSFYDGVAATSDRVQIDTLGMTTRGRPFVMLTISHPDNLARLDRLHAVQTKLADPRTVDGEAELETLLDEGRAIVMITQNIHSTEVGSAQVGPRLTHRLATAQGDPVVDEILENVVLLQIPSLNPDGTQWISDWYNEHVDTEFEAAPMPWLYHYYVGHDNNRDWFTFAQAETQHTVAAQNHWHPQIVHDIHQMGGNGARIFFPPYIDPMEPNVDPGLISAVNQLGSWMAASLTAQGKPGVVINAIYDGYHPGRAYMHYHGGARILSETASARMATPVNVPRERVRGGREYEASQASWNFPWPWEGGDWGLPDIVEYMDAGAMALLTNAARNRRFWLENFHNVQRRSVEGWDAWPAAWVIPAKEEDRSGLDYALRILAMGDVEVREASRAFAAEGREFPAGSYVVQMSQPNAAFAQTLLEVQQYPDLREYPGGPPKRPYDVTAHTLPLLMGFEAVRVEDGIDVPVGDPIAPPPFRFDLPAEFQGRRPPRLAVYKGWQEPMMAGWTRWVLDQHGFAYDTLHNADLQAGDLKDRYDAILFQSQSPSSILDGFAADRVPEPYAGGIGAAGSEALRTFVNDGGRLVMIEEATELGIELFDLPVESAVDGLEPQDFYIPGSILEMDMADGSNTPAWYWRSSRAFETTGPGVEVVARYGAGDPLLSGWALGIDNVAGKPALLRAPVGNGEVILFGFQPNYRSQTVVTLPILWKALSGTLAQELMP